MRGLVLSLLFLIAIGSAFAHVGYVATPEQIAEHSGSDWSFFFSPLQDPINIILILGTIGAVTFLYVFLKHSKTFMRYVHHIEHKAHTYSDLTSWMLRLSVGISLIGAGTAGVLITPILPGHKEFAIVQILIGFLLLTGIFIVPAIFVAITIWLFALSQTAYAIGNLEFAAILIALLIQANPIPGLDHLFEIDLYPSLEKLKRYVPLILRIGIGGAMCYLAVYEKFLNPHVSALVVENYHLTSAIPVSAAMWVFAAGLIELAVGLALFFGFHTRLTASIAFLVLSTSFFYFNEAVYSHVTLFGVLSVLLVTGGGAYSIDAWIKKLKS